MVYSSNYYYFPGYLSDGIFVHFLASMLSGLVTTAASMPVDIAKTRIQNMRYIDGKPEYKGAVVSNSFFSTTYSNMLLLGHTQYTNKY